jgi:hypothetical protein
MCVGHCGRRSQTSWSIVAGGRWDEVFDPKIELSLLLVRVWPQGNYQAPWGVSPWGCGGEFLVSIVFFWGWYDWPRPLRRARSKSLRSSGTGSRSRSNVEEVKKVQLLLFTIVRWNHNFKMSSARVFGNHWSQLTLGCMLVPFKLTFQW